MDIALLHQSRSLSSSFDIANQSERQLISALLAGKRSAQKAFYQQYFGKLIGITLRYTRTKEEAYEVLNDAFIKVFKSIHQFQGTGSFQGWVYKIVQFTAYQYVRDNYKIGEVEKAPLDHQVSVENEAWSNLGLEHIYSKIQLLPDGQRTVFSMYVLDGLKHQEIADKLGISAGTSKWYLSKARIQLQQLLK